MKFFGSPTGGRQYFLSDDCQDRSSLREPSWFFLFIFLGGSMADKQTIQTHLSLTSTIKLTPSTPELKGAEIRKAKVMEHVKKSRG